VDRGRNRTENINGKKDLVTARSIAIVVTRRSKLDNGR